MKKTDIYELKMHQSEEYAIGGLTYFVLRVPHGWIYTIATSQGLKSSVFVPFVNSNGEE